MAAVELCSGECPQCKKCLHYPACEASIECRHCNLYHMTTGAPGNGGNEGVVKQSPYQDVLCRELEKLVFRENKAETLQNTTWSSQEEKDSFVSQAISPLLSYWGMDKQKIPRRLTKLGNPMEFLDCTKILGKRAALLSPDEAKKVNHGSKERSDYARGILQSINGEADLVAVQVPVKGGGHGLFLAISLALVGKEIFWHALQLNVFQELRDKKQQYNSFLKEQKLEQEWDLLLSQCDPNSTAHIGGKKEVRKVYLLALANVLKRPIILLDGQKDDSKSGVFLPLFYPAKDCVKGGLCLVWADKDRTHVEPLLGIKEGSLIQIPANIIPRVWSADQAKLKEYCDIKSTGRLVIKGKPLPESYVFELTTAMSSIFTQENGIGVNLLSDVYRCVYRSAGLLNIPPPIMIDTIKQAMADQRLYRCLDCRNISIMPEAVLPGGRLYKHAKSMTGEIQKNKKYCFIALGYQCQYDENTDRLVAIQKLCRVLDCPWCEKKRIRQMTQDGEPILKNGDITRKGKYHWNGEEFDSNPKEIPIGLEWKGEVYPDTILWFYDQKDPTLNSSVEGTIDFLVQKHFPDETDSKLRERVARIVKLRLSQQHDLDIPGIEKYKRPEFKPPSLLPDPDQTTVMGEGSSSQPVGGAEGGAAAPAVGAEGGGESQTDVDTQQTENEDEDKQPSSDDNDSLYIGDPEPQTAGPAPQQTEAGAKPKQKRIKVQHNRKTEIIDIPISLTFAELQNTLERKLGIPVNRQYIKHGFPPQLITVPFDKLHAPYMEIQNNDSLIVEDRASGGSMPKEGRSPITANNQKTPPSGNSRPLGGATPGPLAANTGGAAGRGGVGSSPAREKTPAEGQKDTVRTPLSKDSTAMKVLLKLRKMLEEVDKTSGYTSARVIQNVLENKDTQDGDAGAIIADLLKEPDIGAVTEAVTLWRRSIHETKQSK